MKFIYPPTIHWEGGIVFQRPQQLMKAFANAGHRSVFMEYGRYDGTVYFRDGVEICDCRSLLPKVEEITVLWATHPPYYRLKDAFHADLLVFDYIDEAAEEFAIWNNTDLKEAMEQADVITVVSQRLYDMITKQFPTKTVILLPNAADYDHFYHSKKLPIPPDMIHIPQPILGFMGSIASWIDTNLIRQVAKLRPDWSIVLIGNDYLGVGGIFADCPNVYFLGRKLYHELPPYVGQFAVGMVPFQVRDMTHSSSPIKMYEYLAAGVPVLSTPIQEAVECPYVSTGASAQEWVQEVESVLDKKKNTDELQAFALRESWEARVKQVESVLDQIAEVKLAQGSDRNSHVRMHQFPVTSSTYWDIRFLTDWENLRGREQTVFFADVILDHLPKRWKEEINNNRYDVCDAGCGLGDAIPRYVEAFPNSMITGIDFSAEAITKAERLYPSHTFRVQNIENIPDGFDVMFSSNVLALFQDPIAVITHMLERVNQYLILLLPFQNNIGEIENQFVFEADHFPDEIDHFRLVLLEEIDCSQIPRTFCQSKQILVVYKYGGDQ